MKEPAQPASIVQSLAAPDLGRSFGTQTKPGWTPADGPTSEREERPPKPRLTGGTWARIAYGVIDVVLICLNALLAVYVRFTPDILHRAIHLHQFGLGPAFPYSRYVAFLLLYTTLIVLFCQGQDLYRTPRNRSAADETLGVTKAVSLATLFLTGFVFLSGYQQVSRIVVLMASVLNIATLSAWRFWKRKFVIHRVTQGFGARNALIVGAGAVGQALAAYLESNKLLGYRFKGFVDGNHSTDGRLRGTIDDLARIGRAEFIDEIFITIPSERELVKRIAFQARENRWNVKVVPELYDGLGWDAPLHHLGEFPVMELHWEPIPALGLVVKRAMDIVFSTAALVLLAPALGVIAVLIRLDSSGSSLYQSERVGLKGRTFVCYKFRTMVANADALKKKLVHLNERCGPFFKIKNDPRVTRLGRLLRKYSLDELPQLWNVLKGDMSLVGPRPHTLDDYARYKVEQLRRLEIRPGLTGLWQVSARQDPSFETTQRLDLHYIDNWDLWLDLKVLVQTLPAVLRGDGA